MTGVVLVALATLASSILSGCGGDNSTTGGTSSSSAAANDDSAQRAPDVSANVSANAQPAAIAPSAQSTNTRALPNASAPLAANPGVASDAATDLITQNMQASLAADSRQVAPVMHYAPGDSSDN